MRSLPKRRSYACFRQLVKLPYHGIVDHIGDNADSAATSEVNDRDPAGPYDPSQESLLCKFFFFEFVTS